VSIPHGKISGGGAVDHQAGLLDELADRGETAGAGRDLGGCDFYGCRAANGQTRYKSGRDGTRTELITKYRDHLLSRPELIAALTELRGKDLACWCAPEPCDGEVLLELADS